MLKLLLKLLLILFLLSIGFTLSACLLCCEIDFLFGTYITHVVIGFGALLSGSILGLILMIVAIAFIIDWIECFMSEHKNK